MTRAADELAAGLADGPPDRVGLAVSAPGADGLADPFAGALAAALARRGHAPVALPARASPEAARAAGADRLVLVRLALTPAAGQLVAAAEVVPLRENFFLQRMGRAPSRHLTASAHADAEVRALARPQGERPTAPALVPLFTIGEPVLALAVDEAGDAPTLLVATSRSLSRHARDGQLLASRPAPAPPAGPRLRRAAAALAVGDYGGGRVAWQLAGSASAEVLDGQGASLRPVASLAAAPIASGGAGALYGTFAPGLPLLLDRLSPGAEPAALLRSGRLLQGAAAAPRPGRAAFAVLRADGVAELLTANLEGVGAPVEAVGAGFALADVDGDGEPELVASSTAVGESDRVRLVRPGSRPEVVYQSPPVPGAILAAAAGDLTGDGLDDAVLAAEQPDGETRIWLLTSDAREVAR